MNIVKIDMSGHDPIHVFEINISGFANREIISNLLDKIWNMNRWRGRFYYGIRQMGHRWIVEFSKVTKKDEINKVFVMKQIHKLLPNAKNKLITLS